MTPVRIGNAIYGTDPFMWQWIHERIGGAIPAPPRTRDAEELPVKTIGFLSPVSGKLGAGIVYFDYRDADITVGLAIEDRRTVTREMIDHCCRYPFRQLRAGRATALVREPHHALRNVMERMGFVLEGRKRGTDICMYGLLAADAERWMRDGRITENPSGSRAA